MATLPSSSSLHLSTPFPARLAPRRFHAPRPFQLFFTPRGSSDSEKTPPAENDTEPKADPDEFDSRLSQVRLRYRSGTGKKAEIRKVKKKGGSSGGGAGGGGGMYLPPVPLKETVSEGMKVDFGFSPYSERINGRIAMLGLTALVLVELATGKGVINYHTPAIVLIQVYFVAAVGALFIKYEKEKVSIWPQSLSDK
ncbi:uncharacterized protein LOC116194940 [Punica granatum]|uniref:Uncharacterized protein LOC116194940 n=1 Tax=Punica granatum TaxID=22663 RepID=A0A218WB64_PUNGR|nr:uncharacterized protein LOC116194940 [Punica granatum]OWM70117.1 hypothetical protein CDL15_Pgr025967 [Punica granatum]